MAGSEDSPQYDWAMARCIGDVNVGAAMVDKIDKGWDFYAIVPNGVYLQTSPSLDPNPQQRLVPQFIVFFRQPRQDPEAPIIEVPWEYDEHGIIKR